MELLDTVENKNPIWKVPYGHLAILFFFFFIEVDPQSDMLVSVFFFASHESFTPFSVHKTFARVAIESKLNALHGFGL